MTPCAFDSVSAQIFSQVLRRDNVKYGSFETERGASGREDLLFLEYSATPTLEKLQKAPHTKGIKKVIVFKLSRRLKVKNTLSL